MIYKHIFVDIIFKQAFFYLYTVKWLQVLLYSSHNLTSVIYEDH